MCGLAALFTPGTGAEVALPDLLKMHALLAHRGPDGEGLLLLSQAQEPSLFRRIPTHEELRGAAPRLALAVRRLSIQDPSEAAAQPLAAQDGRLFIAFNGEIYNFREIRRGLEADGHTFRTTSDTEVALAAYERWGSSCFEKFNGMWALLILDLRRGRLVGSRDRLGIKPLFYAVEQGRLLLASEPRAIAAVMRGGPRIQPYRFREFLKGIPPQSAELSFFEGVHPVPAGAIFEIDITERRVRPPEFRRFWNLADHVCDGASPPAFEEAARDLSDLLRSAVEMRLAADARVGSFLSGGLDSSTVTRMMAGHASAGASGYPAFSLVYDDPEMDESKFIDAVLEMGGVDGRREKLDPDRAWALADSVIEAQGEPLLGWDLLAQYHAYRFARQNGVKVILEGQGGDELLGGYGVFEWSVLQQELRRVSISGFAAELRGLASAYGRSPLGVLRLQASNQVKLHLLLGTDLRRPEWLLAASRSDFGPSGAAGRSREGGRDPSPLNRALYTSTIHTNLPGVLLHQDRNSMAHGIESRVPFLDHRVVEKIFQLPARHKIHRGVRKRILRELAGPLLPKEITGRKDKKAFVSTTRWIPLRRHAEELRAMSRSAALAGLPWIDSRKAARHVDRYLAGESQDHLSVWRLYSAWRWLEIFRPSI